MQTGRGREQGNHEDVVRNGLPAIRRADVVIRIVQRQHTIVGGIAIHVHWLRSVPIDQLIRRDVVVDRGGALRGPT